MTDTIFGEASGIYRLEGERIFHDETRVWEETLGLAPMASPMLYAAAVDSPEWMDWWTSTVDITVKPGSFDKAPAFTIDQANLTPRFGKMRKAQLADWIATFYYPTERAAIARKSKTLQDTNTRSQLQTLAMNLWQQPATLKGAMK